MQSNQFAISNDNIFGISINVQTFIAAMENRFDFDNKLSKYSVRYFNGKLFGHEILCTNSIS